MQLLIKIYSCCIFLKNTVYTEISYSQGMLVLELKKQVAEREITCVPHRLYLFRRVVGSAALGGL